jgi:hypothetical protein
MSPWLYLRPSARLFGLLVCCRPTGAFYLKLSNEFRTPLHNSPMRLQAADSNLLDAKVSNEALLADHSGNWIPDTYALDPGYIHLEGRPVKEKYFDGGNWKRPRVAQAYYC